VVYFFEGHSLDPARRELRRGGDVVAVEPQVFDLLEYLIRHRDRVVSKDDLLAAIWKGRIVSESTLSSRITAVRQAVGDSGEHQRLIHTVPRKGLRFVASVREAAESDGAPVAKTSAMEVAERAPVAAAPQRRQLSIVRCRAIDPVADAPSSDPEDLRDVVAAYYECVAGVVEKHGGFVADRAGDEVVAYFGYPEAHEDDAERAVRSALAVVETLGACATTRIGRPLRARAGVATGQVVVGEFGHAAVGEAPQTAARLAASGDPGTVLICGTTRRLVGTRFDYREGTAPLAASGAAAQVLRERPSVDRFEALHPRRTRLVGRDEELTLLLRRWGQVKSGEGRVVLIWGEPGIGKSHLVASLQDALHDERHTGLRYFCSPHRSQTALHPVIAQLERAAGFAHGDSDATKLEKLESLLALSSRDIPGDAVLFAGLLSIDVGSRYPPLSISAERRKELLLERCVAQLAGLAAHRPVLLVLEDAHWIDPTSRELFDVIVERVRGLPVLFVMTYRPEFAPPWLGQSHVTALTLNRLGRRDNAALVRQVADGKELPPALVERIATQTDGVPLFVEEVTKSVLESGLLREAEGGYVLTGPLPVLAVPATLQASLAARLDRLAPARGLVQIMAGLGREFSYSVLKSVAGLPAAELESSIRALVATELVHQRGTIPSAAFIFKHALVQEAAYATMLRTQRSQIHRRIVDAFEHEFPDTVEHHPDVLAYHCAEAGQCEKAIDYAIRAARMALGRSAGVEAQAQVEAAMSLLARIAPGSERQQLEGRLHVALGDALTMTKGFASPEVMAALTRARELLDESRHPVESLGALCGLFNYRMIRSESPLCLALAEPLLARATDAPTAAVVHYLAGTAHLHLGNFARSIAHLEQALAGYDEEGCRGVAFVAGYHLRSFTLIWLGLAHLYVGSLQRATETIAAAVADARGRSHPFTLVSALLALARFRNQTHDVPGAIEATEEGMAIAAEQRSPYHLSRAGILRAVNVIDSGRPEEGIVLMERALVAHRRTGANFQSSYNLSRLAEAHARSGRVDRAVELATEAVAEVERSGERWWESEALRIRGETMLRASPARRGEAERCFVAALECARRQRARLWELHAAQSLAELWSAEGRAREAGELLRAAHDAFADDVDLADLRRARDFLARRGVRQAHRH